MSRYQVLSAGCLGLPTLLPSVRHRLLRSRLPRRLHPLPLLMPPIMKRLVRQLFLHPPSLHPVMLSTVEASHRQASFASGTRLPPRQTLAPGNHARLQSSFAMHPARIAELLQPFLSGPCHSEKGQRPSEEPAVLSAAQLQSISTYIDILRRWNARINLTAIRDEEEIVTRHFGESLFAASYLFPHCPVSSPVTPGFSVVKGFAVDSANDGAPDRVADLGSGAGFPGIPIKLWAPNTALTLIESNQKKATFLREIVRALNVADVTVQNARAETLPPAMFDVVSLRAVEHFIEALPVAMSLLAPSGRLALLLGSSQLAAVRSALPKVIWNQPIPVPRSQSRVLMVGTVEPENPTGGTKLP